MRSFPDATAVGNDAPRAALNRSTEVGRALLWALAWSALLTLAIHELLTYDVWWQIAAGDWILANGIPTTDPFSYAFPDREWIEPRWLFCVLVAAVAGSFGLNALILLEAVFLLAAFALLVRGGDRTAWWTAPFAMTLALAIGFERFMVRPELVSFVLLMLTLLLLQRFRETGSRWWILPLPLIQVVWSNAHTLWILGPAVQWIVVVGELLEARMARALPRLFQRTDRIEGRGLVLLVSVAALSSLAAWGNPYFLRGVAFPFRLFGQISSGHFLSSAINEFRGPLTSGLRAWDYPTVAYIVVVVISAVAFLLNRRALALGRLLLWLAFLLLSLKAQRNVALFGFVAAYTTMHNLAEYCREEKRARTLRPIALGAATLFLAIAIPYVATDRFYLDQGSQRRFGFGVSDQRFPVRALAFLREEGIPGPVLHTLGDGGYVAFDGGPKSVYVDGRLEVYGSQILEDAARLTFDGAGLAEEARRTGARVVLVPNEERYRGLLIHLEGLAEWVPIYFDPLHIVYLQTEEATSGWSDSLGFTWDDPPSRAIARPAKVDPPDWLAGLWPRRADPTVDERLGSLLAGVGNFPRALEHFEAAVQRAPWHERSNLFLLLFYEALGREAEASVLRKRVSPSLLRSADVQLLAARIELWASRPGHAADRYAEASRLGAPQPDTGLRLARAAAQAGQLDRALDQLDRLSREYPDLPEAWNLLGAVAIRLGRTERAIRAFESSLRVEPKQPAVFRALAQLYERLGALDKSEEMRRRGAVLD